MSKDGPDNDFGGTGVGWPAYFGLAAAADNTVPSSAFGGTEFWTDPKDAAAVEAGTYGIPTQDR